MSVLRFLGKGLLFILRQVFLASLIVILLVGMAVGVTKILLEEHSKESIIVKDNSYLELDFSKQLVEKENESFFELEKSLSLFEILEVINFASTDPCIKGIYMDIDSVNISANHIEEIGQALDKFRQSGKKIYAFTRNIDNNNYRLGIYADKIAMPPINSSSIDLTGYYREFNYFKGLTDFIGIKFNVIHIGDYKTYGEQYSKDTMSPEFKSDIKRVYDRVYNDRILEISKRRNLENFALNTSILDGKLVMVDPHYGKKVGLIDDLFYQDDFEKQYKIKEKISVEDYLSTLDIVEKKDKIAIIYASGEILYHSNSRSSTSIDIETIKQEIKIAQDNDDIKGIVLRVNSPGGSALASEIIHHELSKVTKPIYVSMGSVAASGGYYISSGADKIFATKSTITGSIGVVSIIPDISALVEKSKINIERVQKGKYSNTLSLTTPMTDEEFEKIKISSQGIYAEFKDRVSKGRNIDLDQLEKIAGGRIWLGEEAINNRLVDKIGGLDDTIRTLGEDLKLEDYQVIEISKRNSIYETILKYKGAYAKVGKFIKSPVEESINLEIKKPLLLMPYEFN